MISAWSILKVRNGKTQSSCTGDRGGDLFLKPRARARVPFSLEPIKTVDDQDTFHLHFLHLVLEHGVAWYIVHTYINYAAVSMYVILFLNNVPQQDTVGESETTAADTTSSVTSEKVWSSSAPLRLFATEGMDEKAGAADQQGLVEED